MIGEIRCDSCGEEIYARIAYRVQFWPMGDNDYLTGEVCEQCAREFLSGKMHAEATTDHSKLG